MKIYLLRHGRTAYNTERRYQGQRDIPLAPEGAAELREAGFSPRTVYVSRLRRAGETARVLFPAAAQEVVPGLEEIDFGSFEGRTADELETDPEYRAWIESGATLPCPGGESMRGFAERSCAAFEALLLRALRAGEDPLVIVAHGGTLCAVAERYAAPAGSYFEMMMPNGSGYLLEYDEALWRAERKLRLLERVYYTKEDAGC